MNKINVKTQCKKMLADVYTPVGIYLRLRDRFRDTILLESTDFHTHENSWSFIGIQAIAGFEVSGFNAVEYKYPAQPAVRKAITDSRQVVQELNQFIARFEPDTDCPLPVAQGLFGYTCYDAVQFFDSVKLSSSGTAAFGGNKGEAPLLRYRFYQYVIAINHFKDELYICENQVKGIESELEVVESLIRNKDVPVYPFRKTGTETSPITDEAYREMVRTGIKHCQRGDVFQVVLSRRFQQPFNGDEFNVYRALRSINPSPYLFYFDYGDYKLFGSSPESQVILQKGKAIIHPIAGTFRRTGDDEKDSELAETLLKDEKENAEHVMLVDLARNDLSRVADEVTVSSYRKVHYYSHVIHLVSEVTGKVKENTLPFDLMAATFPAGTLSGAPKFRAMEIINENETTPRGYYGGAIGFIGFNGDVNHAIMIRSFLSRDNTLYYQAGAGIVARSVPESELQEVNNKLNALKQAIEMAGTIQ
jgi:anthranilate synthase component I